MSFYVTEQLTAIQIGLRLIGRVDIAELDSLEAIRTHPDVVAEDGKVTNICDTEGEHAHECLWLTVKTNAISDITETKIGSAPFRCGFDVWLSSKTPGFMVRFNP